MRHQGVIAAAMILVLIVAAVLAAYAVQESNPSASCGNGYNTVTESGSVVTQCITHRTTSFTVNTPGSSSAQGGSNGGTTLGTTTSTYASTSTSPPAVTWPGNQLANGTLSSPQVQAFIKTAYSYDLVSRMWDAYRSNLSLRYVVLNVTGGQVVTGNWSTGYKITYTGIKMLNVTVQLVESPHYHVLDLGSVDYKVKDGTAAGYKVINVVATDLPDRNVSIVFTAHEKQVIGVALSNGTVGKMVQQPPYYVQSVSAWPTGRLTNQTSIFLVRLYRANATQALDVLVDARTNAVVWASPNTRTESMCLQDGSNGPYYCFTSPWTSLTSQPQNNPPSWEYNFPSGFSANLTLTSPQIFPFIKPAYDYTVGYIGSNSSNLNLVTVILKVTKSQLVIGDWSAGYTISYTGIKALVITAEATQNYPDYLSINITRLLDVKIVDLPNQNQSITFTPDQKQAIQVALANSTFENLMQRPPYYVHVVGPSRNMTLSNVQMYQVNGTRVVDAVGDNSLGKVVDVHVGGRGSGYCGAEGICIHDPWVIATDIPEPPYHIDIAYPGQWTAQVKDYSAGAALPHYLNYASNFTGTGDRTISVPFLTTTGGSTIFVTVQKLDGSNLTLTASISWGGATYPETKMTSAAYGSVTVSFMVVGG